MSGDESLKALYSKEELEFKTEIQAFAEERIRAFDDEIEKMNSYEPIPILMREMGKKGFLGPLHPPEWGGTGQGIVADCIVAEECARINEAFELSRIANISLFGMPIHRFGTDEQKEKYLTPIIKGEKIGCIGITEPRVGSDTAGMETRAVKDGDYYIINGEKRFITNGTEADFMCCFAITTPLPNVHPKKGMSAFIIDTKWKGYERVKYYKLSGLRGARVGHIRFNDLAVPKENLLGPENKGFSILMDELNSERVGIAAQGVGIARAAFEEALKYSTERIQFDQEIRYFEGVSFQIADMAIRIEAGRALTVQAARALNKIGNKAATKICTMAKVFTSEAAVYVASRAMQVLGGIGYTSEKKSERYLRDAKILPIGGGTTEILKYLIQREVYREHGY
ncbi:MAG: acyl-CoA dehydrogenase family protein [Candidatus Helarchaeota archaeon]